MAETGGKWQWRPFFRHLALAVLAVAGIAAIVAASVHFFRIDSFFRSGKAEFANAISLGAAIVALLAFLFASFFSAGSRRDSLRVEKSNAYLNLEVSSSEVFKYEAAHEDRLAPYRTVYQPRDAAQLDTLPNAKIAYNLYFQSLNLFEVCARFRRQEIIEHEVFASWVAWFYDTLDDWYFRDQWDDFRGNYTNDVRDIFDMGVRIFARHGKNAPRSKKAEKRRDVRRKREFYSAVAAHMQCTVIEGWLDRIGMEAENPPLQVSAIKYRLISWGWLSRPEPHRVKRKPEDEGEDEDGPASAAPSPSLQWTRDKAAAVDAGRFFARTIADDWRYISHGEIQCGLSHDGAAWVPNLGQLFVEDMEAMGEDQSLLVARDAGGAIVGAAIVEWTETSRVRFATLADLSIEPRLRSTGLGGSLVAEVEREAQRREMEWIFLESGKGNVRAHRFFERHNFHEVSHVFARRLTTRKGRGNPRQPPPLR